MNATTDNRRRAYWLKTLHQWHWISSGMCLIGMLLFSVTGITLNHATQIEAKPRVTTRDEKLPADLRALLAVKPGEKAESFDKSADKNAAPLPPPLQRWLSQSLSIDVSGRDAEWSPDEVYVALPRPGGDAWVRIARSSGEVEYELTDRGWISYLNDLHKGRNTGVAWAWFIDIFAVAALLFSITGLFILKMHAANRPTTWPIVALGLVVPVVLALLFVH
jgi:hypothetical protein